MCGQEREGTCECGFTAKETSIHFRCGWRMELVVQMSKVNGYELYHSDRNQECHDSSQDCNQYSRHLSLIQRDKCNHSRVLHKHQQHKFATVSVNDMDMLVAEGPSNQHAHIVRLTFHIGVCVCVSACVCVQERVHNYV